MWACVGRRLGNPASIALACLVEAAGVAATVLFDSAAAVLIVAAFGAGQMIGPAYGGYVAGLTGSFTVPSLTASAALVVAAGLAMLVRVDPPS